jgi:hypothetical protein
MDVLDWLNLVLADADLLRTPSEALALLPDIASDGPEAAPLVIDGAPWRGFPAAFAESLEKPVGEFVLARLQDYDAGRQEELADVSGERLMEDPLVLAVAQLLVESGPLGRRAGSLVVLELTRQTSLLFSGHTAELRRNQPSLGNQIERLALGQDDPETRGAALARFAWSLSARLSLSWTLAGRLDPRVQPSRLYQAMVANRLALVACRGTVQLPRDLVLASRVAGGRAQSSSLNATHAAVTAALGKALDGDDGAASRALRDLVGKGRDTASLATDGRLAGWVLHSLGELVTKKELAAAGVAAGHAKSLLDPSTASALGAEYSRACRVLRSWDLLAAVAGRCLPVQIKGGAAVTPQGKLTEKRPWSLLAPRGGPTTAYVVLVRRAEIDEAAGKQVEQHGPAVFGAMDRAWRDLADKAEQLGGVASSDRWLAAFGDKASADKFAAEAERAFRAPIRLDLSPLGPTVALSRDASGTVGQGEGMVIGGWDGLRLQIGGPAVEDALGTVQATGGDVGIGASFLAAAESPPAASSGGGGGDIFQSMDQPTAEDGGLGVADDPFSGASAEPDDPVSADDPFGGSGQDRPTIPELDFGGDPFGGVAASGAGQLGFSDDPFSSAEAEEASTSIPPLGELSDEAFSGVERREEPSVEDGELDPLTGGGDGGLSFSGEGSAEPSSADPFTADDPFGEPEEVGDVDTAEAGAVMSMEIEDDEDDDSEPHDVDDVEMFFLPPPTQGQTDTNETIAPVDEAPGETLAPAPETGATLMPESSMDLEFGFVESSPEPEGGTLVPDGSTIVPDGGTLIPDGAPDLPDPDVFLAPAGKTLAPTDTLFDLGSDEDDEARISITPEVATADNLLELSADEASFEFGDEGSGTPSEALDNLVDNATDAVLEAPEESIDLGVSGSGFMHSGAPPTEDLDEGDDDDPFGFSTIDEASGDEGEGLGFDTVDTAVVASEGDPFAGSSDSNPGMSAADLGYLFEGYVVVQGPGEVRFGRRYGTRLVDVHDYSTSDLEQAYKGFANDKIAERFVPQTERSVELSSSAELAPVDLERLHRALS